MRRALGTTVFSGMLGVTLFGIFLTPVFYIVIDHWATAWRVRKGHPSRASARVLDLLRLGPTVRLARKSFDWLLNGRQAGRRRESRSPRAVASPPTPLEPATTDSEPPAK